MKKQKSTAHLTGLMALWMFGTLVVTGPVYAFAQSKPAGPAQLRAMPNTPAIKSRLKNQKLKPFQGRRATPVLPAPIEPWRLNWRNPVENRTTTSKR